MHPSLRDLIETGDVAAFRSAVSSQAAANQRFADGYTVLHACIRAGRVELVRHALAQGADLAAETTSIGRAPRSALRLAVEAPRPRIVELLLAGGARFLPTERPLEWLDDDAPEVVRRALRHEHAAADDDPRVVVYHALGSLVGLEGPPVSADIPESERALCRLASQDDETQLTLALRTLVPGDPPKKWTKALRAERARHLWRALDAAVEARAARAVRVLLAHGADPNTGDVTPLHVAVTAQDEATIDALLEYAANPNAWTEEWSYPAGPPHASPIALAAEAGHIGSLRAMLSHVKRITKARERMPGVDPLAIAANEEVAALLLEHGVSVTDEGVAHLLDLRAWALAEKALTGNPRLGKPFPGEASALDVALAASAPAKIVSRLLDLGATPTTAFPKETSPELLAILAKRGVSSPQPTKLEEVAKTGTAAEVRAWLAQHAFDRRRAPMALAELGRHALLLELATELEPDDESIVRAWRHLDAPTGLRLLETWGIGLDGARATKLLADAVRLQCMDCALALLQANVALTPIPEDGASIDIIARAGHVLSMECCLERATPSLLTAGHWLRAATRALVPTGERDRLALTIVERATHGSAHDLAVVAAWAGWIQGVDLAARRDPAIFTKVVDAEVAFTPLIEAAAQGHAPIVAMCLERGADPNQRTHRGRPVLAMAAEQGSLAVVRLLVEAGADATATGEHGERPLAWAKTDEVWSYLRQVAGPALYFEA